MEYIFFYSHTKDNGYMSNFSEYTFTESGIAYDTVERYMHYKKALLFNDDKIAKNIINSNTPQEAKMLGRKVKNFDNLIWDEKKVDIVKTGIRLKFEQNGLISQMLLSTGEKYLVEAASNDRIWGIGYSSEKAIKNIGSWGENLLGNILMEIRTELKNKTI